MNSQESSVLRCFELMSRQTVKHVIIMGMNLKLLYHINMKTLTNIIANSCDLNCAQIVI